MLAVVVRSTADLLVDRPLSRVGYFDREPNFFVKSRAPRGS
jgi:hypothetical protein